MLNKLRQTFSKPAAAIALGGMTMLSPLAVQAEDAGYATSASSLDTAVERAEIEALAHDYALFNSKFGAIHIGVSVLKGIDAPGTGPEMAAALEGGVEKVSNKPAEGFHGDNGDKATEVNFYVPLVLPNGKVQVQTLGPYNFTDSVNIIKNWEAEMAPAYTVTASLD